MIGFNLKDGLKKATGLTTEIQNDANAAALGEFIFGASKGCPNLVFLTLGTGVGGGVIADGHSVCGADNAATELGHLKAEWQGGPVCGCGRPGCVEAYVGNAGITRTAQQMLKGAKSILSPDKLTPKDIFDAAEKGDHLAKDIFIKTGYYLGRGISLLIETFNPEKIVLGGGTSGAFDYLMPGIKKALDEYASFPLTRNKAVIERSKYPDDINVIGAAATYVNAQR